MELVRKGLRAIVYAIRALRSRIRIAWFRSLYSGLRVGRRVHLGRGVELRVVKGGSLEIGDDVVIEANCLLVTQGNLSIGPRTFIGTGSIIAATETISIGSDALIGAYVTIRDQDHRFDLSGKPFRAQGSVAEPVSIGENVWLGTKATILKGVSIGCNSIVGANALVNDSIGDRSLAAGVPARVVKELYSSTTL